MLSAPCTINLMTLVVCFLALSFGRADRRWNHYEEGTESPLLQAKHYNGGGGGPGETSGERAEPTFLSRIENQTISVGRDVILGCQVKNLGSNYKVGWLKVSDQTILTLHKRVITHNSRIRVTHDEQRTWNLLIKNVKPEDEGCYMCQINTAVMKKELGCISVLVPPDIQLEKTSSDTTVNEGEDATLVCHATGRPEPTIIWKREDGKAFHVKSTKRMVTEYHGEFLVLHRVRRKDMGAFLCIARNDVPPSVSKRIMLNVNFPPNVSIDHSLVGSPIGEKVILRCMVEAYPSAITYWVRRHGTNGQQEMLLNRPQYNIEEQKFTYKTEVTLTIDEFVKEDVGLYTCVSTNSLGLKESDVRVYEMVSKTTKPLTVTEPSTTPQNKEATLSIIGDIPIDEIPGENKPRGPNGDLKQKLYYDSDRGTTGQRLFNGSYQLLPSKFLLIIILASTLPLIKTC